MKIKRKIVHIDEEKCDGCGLCVPNCAEGALKIIDGKARLVKEIYCDGLGACLGHCPQGAITVIEREAEAFDEQAVKKYLETEKSDIPPKNAPPSPHPRPKGRGWGHACPSARVMNPEERPRNNDMKAGEIASELTQWPVQLMLVPPQAPFLQNADLLIAADCAAFAFGDFHRKFLKGKALVIACPKLDDGEYYVEKLEQIFRVAGLKSATVVHMEVPCCFGLKMIVQKALEQSGVNIPVKAIVVSVAGEIIEESSLEQSDAIKKEV
ncbi:MAG: 4Fe-4S binding protein [Elusimicrobia bacterium]|nr:4Fe-4S binding protein [Elusimicrobiota bacterium]